MVDELKVIGSIINKFQKYKLETYDDYEKYFEDQITMFRQIEQAIPRFSIIRFLYAEISHIHGNNDIHFQMHKKIGKNITTVIVDGPSLKITIKILNQN